MDPGVAAVLGALIALVGAVTAPWVREVITRRSEERRERTEAIRAHVVSHLEALINVHAQGLSAAERSNRILAAHVTGVRLAALLTAEEAIVEHIGEEAMALTPDLEKGDVRLLSLALVTAYQMTILGWIRGATPTSQVRDSYNSWCGELARMAASDPFKPAITRPVDEAARSARGPRALVRRFLSSWRPEESI
jgi:hypothetical protein